jgi:hypothetical protein
MIVMFASGWMSAAVMGPVAVRLDLQGDRLALLGDDRDLLEVEDDVGDVLDHAIDALELVVYSVDADGGDGGAPRWSSGERGGGSCRRCVRSRLRTARR